MIHLFDEIKILALIFCFTFIIVFAIWRFSEAFKIGFEKDSNKTSGIFTLALIVILASIILFADKLNDAVLTLFSIIVGYSLRSVHQKD